MRASSRSLCAAAGLLVLLPSIAAAHPDAGITHGFLHGFGHPLSGWDHLLAMIAVGLWAAQRGGRAAWSLPATFVLTMVLGGALGMSGLQVPGVEAGILASVFVLGSLIALAVMLPAAASHAVVAVFALFHGAAHGAAMPVGAASLGYASGFATATALLHLTGAVLAIALMGGLRQRPRVWVRLAGASICAAGAVFLVLGG